MSGYKRVSFYELCRLCASSHQKDKTHIFQEEGRKIQLQNKIQTCLSLKVCENDFLPKVVCAKCLRSLEVCFSFRQECVTSETMLSSYFKNFRYTEDFKKSGKVYIKDTTKPSPVPASQVATSTAIPTVVPAVTTTNIPHEPQQHNVVTVKANQPIDQVPFYTLQLPTAIVSNPNLKPNGKIEVSEQNKITQSVQPQVAFNLNTINLTALKSMQNVPKINGNEMFGNVVVNSNGEVINIGQIVDFESMMAQTQNVKAKVKQKKKTYEVAEENIVKIDLTESDNTASYDTGQTQIKYDKLPHIKSTAPQVNNKYTYTIKVEEKPQNPTVIFNHPISEYNPPQSNNFTTYNSNTMYSQANLNFVNATTNTNNLVTSSNIICNTTATTAEGSTININVLNQNMQEMQNNTNFNRTISQTQNNFTNVISTVQQPPPPPPIQNQTETANKTAQSSNMVGEAPSSTQMSQSQAVKSHVCDICLKSFKRREHLYQHVKLHTGFRPYICEHCNKAFMRKEHLLRHMTLHSGQKNFTCNICDKSFSRNDNLLKHKKTHEKQTNYTCEVCQKQFVMKHYYIAHKMSHTESKCHNSVWGLLKT